MVINYIKNLNFLSEIYKNNYMKEEETDINQRTIFQNHQTAS